MINRRTLPDSARHLCWVDHALIVACDDGTVLAVAAETSTERVVHRLGASATTLAARGDHLAVGAIDGTGLRLTRGDLVKFAADASIVAGTLTDHAAIFATGADLVVVTDTVSMPYPLDIGDLTSVTAVGDGLVAAGGAYGIAWFDTLQRRSIGHVDLATIVTLATDPLGRSVAAGELGGAVQVVQVVQVRHAVQVAQPHLADAVELSGFSDRVAEVVWLASGTALCAVCDDEITVWGRTPAAFVEEPRVLEGHERPITVLASNPVIDLVASGDDHGNVFVWAPRHGDEPIWRGEIDGVALALAWDRSGRHLAATGSSGELMWLALPAIGLA